MPTASFMQFFKRLVPPSFSLDRVPEFVLGEHAHELVARLPDPLPVVAVHHEDETLHTHSWGKLAVNNYHLTTT